ncbi:MAG: hypothetical protein JNK49_20510 [Planctomycetes bacterium]|nr:hypothetical protein [Planctomycetota bacterium]
MSDPTAIQPCPYCGRRGGRVAVHGHVQCGACGTNLEPCCSGASPADERDVPSSAELLPDPQLFERLFRVLGGPAATVATDSLLSALVQDRNCDLDAARILVDAGERTGRLVRAGDGCHRLGRRG